MSAKTRTQTPRMACISAVRATSQILGESPKRGSPRRSCRQGSTGRKAKIRLRLQQAGEIRRKHGCVRAWFGKVGAGFPKRLCSTKKLSTIWKSANWFLEKITPPPKPGATRFNF